MPPTATETQPHTQSSERNIARCTSRTQSNGRENMGWGKASLLRAAPTQKGTTRISILARLTFFSVSACLNRFESISLRFPSLAVYCFSPVGGPCGSGTPRIPPPTAVSSPSALPLSPVSAPSAGAFGDARSGWIAAEVVASGPTAPPGTVDDSLDSGTKGGDRWPMA